MSVDIRQCYDIVAARLDASVGLHHQIHLTKTDNSHNYPNATRQCTMRRRAYPFVSVANLYSNAQQQDKTDSMRTLAVHRTMSTDGQSPMGGRDPECPKCEKCIYNPVLPTEAAHICGGRPVNIGGAN